MTSQYQGTNINQPRIVRSFTAVSPPISVELTLDDTLVAVDTTADAIGFTLPFASQIPGLEIIIKADNAGTSGNAVTLTAEAGETIDGAAFITLTADQQAVFLKSDGTDWRVISDTGSSGGSSLSLDLTYDITAAADSPPVLYTTWAATLAAIALIPGSAAAPIPYTTRYRLNIQPNSLNLLPAGSYDLNNAHFRPTTYSGTEGIGILLTPGGPGNIGPWEFIDVGRIEGFQCTASSPADPTWTYTDLNYAEIHNCIFSVNPNGGTGAGWFDFAGQMTLRCTGTVEFNFGAIVNTGPGDIYIDAYDRFQLLSTGITSPNDVYLNIFSGGTEISIAQPGIAGTFEVNIGGGGPSGTRDYTLGETIFFSSGTVDFAAATEVELYAGGTNPTGATAPQTAFTTPLRGYNAPKHGILRGVSVRIPTVNVNDFEFTISVYVGGILAISETFFTGTASQFSDLTFATYAREDNIQVTLTPVGTGVAETLADGIVVALRSA